MPIYEFICLDCHKRFDARLAFSEYGKKPVICSYCQSKRVQRRIGRIRIAKSEDSRLEDLTDPAALDSLEDDPKSMGRMLRKMKSSIGQEVSPEFDEVVNRLETGQTPQEIEKDLPDMDGTMSPESGGDLTGSDDDY